MSAGVVEVESGVGREEGLSVDAPGRGVELELLRSVSIFHAREGRALFAGARATTTTSNATGRSTSTLASGDRQCLARRAADRTV